MGPLGVRMGLKSRTLWLPLPTGVTFHSSGNMLEGGLLGVDEVRWLLLFIGVLKENSRSGLGCSCRSSSESCMSWKAEASETTPESKKVLLGHRRRGSSCRECTKCCLRRELLAAFFDRALGVSHFIGTDIGSSFISILISLCCLITTDGASTCVTLGAIRTLLVPREMVRFC